MLNTSNFSNKVILALSISLFFSAELIYAGEFQDLLDSTFSSMSALESDKDPKCHATATRLENLVYGTPLNHQARFDKTEYQKALVLTVWKMASDEQETVVNLEAVEKILAKLFRIKQENELLEVSFEDQIIMIEKRDLEHYGSIAYSLRAILAVQQEQLFSEDALPPLSKAAVAALKEHLDIVTLALLQVSDRTARIKNKYEITPENLSLSWQSLFPAGLESKMNLSVWELLGNKIGATWEAISAEEKNKNFDKKSSFIDSSTKLSVLRQLIDNKQKEYSAYNQISNTLFLRNMQVYFAKLSLPKSEEETREFRQAFTEALVAFSANLYLIAQEKAGKNIFIREVDVHEAIKNVLPHEVDEYEDVIFFPTLTRNKQVYIESYDLDAFRDYGLHWQYLGYALDDLKDQIKKEADPFAAELLTETIAHYAVLLLRTAGKLGKQKDLENLSKQLLLAAYDKILQQVELAKNTKPTTTATQSIASSQKTISYDNNDNYFTNVSATAGINMAHRSSDWLSRLLRSYLQKDDATGIITIPPAFGGSGVAAEDINGDGLVDILVLSGLGNRLYLNKGGMFEDITKAAGLDWVRKEDKLPGEPRQPLIADWDNDGDQDIIITYVDDKHRVYRNNGDTTFEDMTEQVNLGGKNSVGGPATTFDINNDGLLDLYIEYFGDYLHGKLPTLKRRNDNGLANQLFLNQGNFKFEKIEGALGADNTGWGQAVTHTDINQDGWQDLIVGNDFGVNAYYLNQQGKNFINYAEPLNTDKPSYTMNVGISDLNQDGITDFYISNIVTMNKDEKYVLPTEDTEIKFDPENLGNMRVIEGNDLFISNKDGGKIKYQLSKKIDRGFSSTGWAWDADFFDVDNDTDDDLYVLNGMNDYYVYSTKNPYYADPHRGENMQAIFPAAEKAANVFFLNSKGKLQNTSQHSGLDFVANSRSAAYFDIENDGDLDVIINNYHDKTMLFRNNAERLGNNWLKLKLVGSPEHGVNKDAIGAQLILVDNKSLYIWRQVLGSQGYMSVHPKQQHFGLGEHTWAHVLVIWPNGKRQKFAKIAANKDYILNYDPEL